MRLFSLACTTLLSSAMALAQSPMVRSYSGAYGYGPYGPFVPLVTTPEVSLETGAPAPVGASNATHGLVAGASNATLSIVTGNTSYAISIASAEAVTKIVLYYVHERIWRRVAWGRMEADQAPAETPLRRAA